MNRILVGDSLQVLKQYPDNTFDSVVTDPPYGLAFMGKKWDYQVPSIELWKEVLRVLKPGGHLLSFGGTRTYHRMVVNVEDAGFEVRDQLQWLFGQGFPKSLNLGNGWGTALKPANEPILLARKPLSEKTVAANVLRWGTGGINVDASRIAGEPVPCQVSSTGSGFNKYDASDYPSKRVYQNSGRFPSNLLLDEQAAQMLDEQAPLVGGSWAKAKSSARNTGVSFDVGIANLELRNEYVQPPGKASRFFYVAKASSRERNAGVEKNTHPTVKPIKLMEYLVRLVTPTGGLVLDPFVGSGTTALAAKNCGFDCVGIEQNAEYAKIAMGRTGNE